MWAIIKFTLLEKRWQIFWWVLGISAVIAMNLAFYPSFKDQSEALEQTFAELPDAAVALFSDTGDFLSPVGYLSSQVYYLLLPLLLAVLGIILGTGLLAKEEKSGTLELLLSRPISRTRLLFAKFFGGALVLLIVGLICAIVTVGLCALVEIEIPLSNIIQASVLAQLFATTVFAFGYFLTATNLLRTASAGITIVYALFGYVAASLIEYASWLEAPAKFMPFYYYRPSDVLNGVYDWRLTAYYLLVILIIAILGTFYFRRRDIS
jgi:ABC-2 type transport system permease protein